MLLSQRKTVEMDETLSVSALESCVIFYDTAVVAKLEEGMFWLSTHPHIESKFPDSKSYRIAIWAKFEVKATGEAFYFYSTHLDTVASTQTPSIECINEQVAAINEKYGDAPVVICGNFNFSPDKEPYAALQKYFTDAAVLNVPTTTFPNWGYNKWSKNYRIDYFVSRGACKPIYYEVDTRVYNPQTEESLQLAFDPEMNAYGYYSDHAPLYAEYEIY